MVLLGCLVAQTRGVMFAREGDNVVFVREPGKLFDPSNVKVGLSRDRCVYIFLSSRGQSCVYFKSVQNSA